MFQLVSPEQITIPESTSCLRICMVTIYWMRLKLFKSRFPRHIAVIFCVRVVFYLMIFDGNSYCKEIIVFYQQARKTSNLCKQTRSTFFWYLSVCVGVSCVFSIKKAKRTRKCYKTGYWRGDVWMLSVLFVMEDALFWICAVNEGTNSNTMFIHRNLKGKCQISLQRQRILNFINKYIHT